MKKLLEETLKQIVNNDSPPTRTDSFTEIFDEKSGLLTYFKNTTVKAMRDQQFRCRSYTVLSIGSRCRTLDHVVEVMKFYRNVHFVLFHLYHVISWTSRVPGIKLYYVLSDRIHLAL